MDILDYTLRELTVPYLGRNDLAHANPEDFASTTMGGGGLSDGTRLSWRHAV